MSERMQRILESSEELRQLDIELGRKLERERIIELLVNQEVEPLPAWDIYVRSMIEIVEENS